MIEHYEKLYRAFVPTKNKQSTMKYKDVPDADLLSYEDVKDLPEFSGILKENIVLIDIDDKEQTEIMMQIVEDLQLNCKVHQSRKGGHFLFVNDGTVTTGTKVKLANSIIADIKVGCRNGIETLKIDGQERFCEWDIEEGQEYQVIPKWLTPISSKYDFLNMAEGGRNSALFGYELVLQSNGFTKEEVKETIGIINKYIIKEPLAENEIDTITRDEALMKETFFDKGQFLHNKFADYLKSQYSIKRINGQLSCFIDGCYQSGMPIIENTMIQAMPRIKSNQRTEVWKYLDKTILKNERCDCFKNMIAFKNGIYNIDTSELLPSSPEYIVTNQIPFDYNQNAYCELTDKTLNKISCGDADIRKLIEEMIGVCFYRSAELQRSFILTGSGANGKSTLLETIKYLLGEENVAQLDLCELGEKFSIATLSSKLANIGDDISDDFADAKAVSAFKKIATGNGLKAENKGQDPYFFKPICKMLFSANSMPKLKSSAFKPLKRRLIIVPFNAEFKRTDADYDRNIEYKLKSQQSIEYLIKIGVDGLKRVLESDFTICQKTEKEMEEFEIQNNPILSWLKSLDDEEFIFHNDLTTVYRNYERFCELDKVDKCQCLGIELFSKQLRKTLNLTSKRKTINGKKVTMFEKIV